MKKQLLKKFEIHFQEDKYKKSLSRMSLFIIIFFLYHHMSFRLQYQKKVEQQHLQLSKENHFPKIPHF